MPDYLTPGVYIEEVPSGNRVIEHAPTNVCAFIGICAGVTEEGPVRVASFDDYQLSFPDSATAFDAMWCAARAFFSNGGSTAWICPVTGAAGAVANAADYSRVLDAVMADLSDVSILVYPDQQWHPTGNGILADAAVRCEVERRMMLFIDPPGGYEYLSERSVSDLSLPAGSFVVSYYPWLQILLPTGLNVMVSPSASMAGIWSRIDNKRAVWKSPAGLEAALVGVYGLEWQVPRLLQSQLNPLGINCIRDFPLYGHLAWGARTRAPRSDAQWRYIAVRRTLTYIQQSIAAGTHWTVFEQNDGKLWGDLRQSINDFLNDLFRQGAFAGAKPADAWFVQCGLGQTMTALDVQEGRVVVELGVALVKPAEFVVLRLELAAAT